MKQLYGRKIEPYRSSQFYVIYMALPILKGYVNHGIGNCNKAIVSNVYGGFIGLERNL